MINKTLIKWIFIIFLLVCASATSIAWVTWDTDGQFGSHKAGRWIGQVTWRYNPANEPANIAGCPRGNDGIVPQVILDAFQTWEDDPGSNFNQHYGGVISQDSLCGDHDNANVVGWEDLGQYDPNSEYDDRNPDIARGQLAVTFEWIVVAGTIIESDINFNTRVAWHIGQQAPPQGTICLQTVALHEVGHFLGLDHPDVSPGSWELGTNGQRDTNDYDLVVMYPTYQGRRLKLTCDDKSGVNYLYPPPGVVIENRDYVTQNSGGCDFSDAPDPFGTIQGKYPSLEANNGARHKDSRMEWLGPIALATGYENYLPAADSIRPTLEPKNKIIPAPAPNSLLGPGGVLPGQTPPHKDSAASPANATFEPYSNQINADEMDDGVSLRGPLIGGKPVLIDILIQTGNLSPANRYDPSDADKRLYLNGWEDWNADGDFADWVWPANWVVQIAGGNPHNIKPNPSNEYILTWNGTINTDQFASENFVGGFKIPGKDARVLTFWITPPQNAVFDSVFYERFRLDYGENVGMNLRTFSDKSLLDTNGTALDPYDIIDIALEQGFEHGEAKYGEVEDYHYKKLQAINKTVHQGIKKIEVWDFKIVLEGIRKIDKTFNGVVASYSFKECVITYENGNTVIHWKKPVYQGSISTPIPFCTTIHIGWSMEEMAKVISAHWTDFDGNPIYPEVKQSQPWLVVSVPCDGSITFRIPYDQTGSAAIISDVYYSIVDDEFLLSQLNEDNPSFDPDSMTLLDPGPRTVYSGSWVDYDIRGNISPGQWLLYRFTENSENDYTDFGQLKIESVATGYQYLPGDANMAAGLWRPVVVGGDVTYLVNYFRGIVPPCLLDGFYCSADINGNCSVTGADVTRLVNFFQGLNSIDYCPDYEPAWHSPADIPSERPYDWPNCEF